MITKIEGVDGVTFRTHDVIDRENGGSMRYVFARKRKAKLWTLYIFPTSNAGRVFLSYVKKRRVTSNEANAIIAGSKLGGQMAIGEAIVFQFPNVATETWVEFGSEVKVQRLRGCKVKTKTGEEVSNAYAIKCRGKGIAYRRALQVITLDVGDPESVHRVCSGSAVTINSDPRQGGDF